MKKLTAITLTTAIILSLAACNTDSPENPPPETTAAPVITTTAETTVATEKPEFSGQCGDNLTWELESNTLTIKGTGAMYDFLGNGKSNSPWNSLDMSRVIIDEGCTYIGDYAFHGCKELTYIEIPSTVKELGIFSLSSVNIETISYSGNGFDRVGSQAFSGVMVTYDELIKLCKPAGTSGKCGKDLYWDLKDGVLTISGTGTMDDYTQSELQPWNSLEFAEVIIEDGCTYIGANAFSYKDSLKTVTVPDSVKKIDRDAFTTCIALENVNLGNGVEVIEMNAFACSRAIKSITIPDSVKTISFFAFAQCTGLEDLVIPDTVEDIMPSAFSDVKHITYYGSAVDAEENHWGALSIN